MGETKIEAGVVAGSAEVNSFWAPEREAVLRKGLPGEPNGRGQAIEKLRTLHPKLKKLNTIEKRIDGVAPTGLAIWMTAEFWKKEIDLALIEGIYARKKKRPLAIERIRTVWPELDSEGLSERMEYLAFESQPAWFQKSFWDRLDPILLAGMKRGRIEERQAIDKVLKLHPELRIERVWARIRDLRHRNRKATQPHTGPFPWTEEQEQRLLVLCREVGLKDAASVFQRETGWPRDAIIRKAHNLGVPKKVYQRKQEWSEIDRTFLLVSVRHVPVKRIARQLGRPEKSVWVQIWREGLPGAWDEGYSRRELCRKFHVSSATLRGWVRSELLKDGADGRIPERSVRMFLRQHPELVDWDRLDPEARQWVLDLSAKEDGADTDEFAEESGGIRLKPSVGRQLAATTAQT